MAESVPEAPSEAPVPEASVPAPKSREALSQEVHILRQALSREQAIRRRDYKPPCKDFDTILTTTLGLAILGLVTIVGGVGCGIYKIGKYAFGKKVQASDSVKEEDKDSDSDSDSDSDYSRKEENPGKKEP
jgi:hypothetical protein